MSNFVTFVCLELESLEVESFAEVSYVLLMSTVHIRVASQDPMNLHVDDVQVPDEDTFRAVASKVMEGFLRGSFW